MADVLVEVHVRHLPGESGDVGVETEANNHRVIAFKQLREFPIQFNAVLQSDQINQEGLFITTDLEKCRFGLIIPD